MKTAILAISILGLVLTACDFSLMCTANCDCESKMVEGGEQYCFKTYHSNLSSDETYHYEIRSHAEDERHSRETAEARRVEQERQACYNSGTSWNETYDIMLDYNFTCPQLAYINDHLVDNYVAKDGGYIRNSYRGFFSRYETNVQITQWVNERVTATGMLVAGASYHKDCNNVTTINKKYPNIPDGCSPTSYGWSCSPGQQTEMAVTYYSTADFVMYYVDHCIGNEGK